MPDVVHNWFEVYDQPIMAKEELQDILQQIKENPEEAGIGSKKLDVVLAEAGAVPTKHTTKSLGDLFYWGKLGRFQKIGEIADLIPKFKDFYYEKKFENTKNSAMKIIRDFQADVDPLMFVPYPAQYRSWRVKWDKDILEQMGMRTAELALKKEVNAVVKMRDENNKLLIPDHENIEGGMNTLAGALINDAMGMLNEDKESEEIYTSDELIKRRNYMLQVMAHTTRLVQGEKGLKIKANAEKRETAGFLMELLKSARSGKMSEEQMALLKDSMLPNKAEPQTA